MRPLTDPAVLVAPTLLGAVVRVGDVAVRLTEVEAYAGESDPASHAYRGRTRRNAAMFAEAGAIYCYLSHGIHTAVNIVCREEGVAEAVLLRAGEVVAGTELARQRRGAGVPDHRLARGPGCLGQALGLRVLDSGRRLGDAGLSLAPAAVPASWTRGARVGVSRAADVLWRFWIPGDATVSAYRRNRHAPAPPA
ncbi:DNA-3-methyladenine glycosylase [Propionicicella superfundia]|uniref:DNA-3-methyladenine glycosylase n=1 Tax=Propionicicella superfundia TaxID=348582 RepID=UPI00048E195C|nr:DNA-3-methyladenine glycosylase [Propionicicella superfundia]